MPLCQRPAGSAKICEHEARRLTESTKSAWLNEQVNSLCNLGESFSMRPYLEPYYMDGDLKIVNFVSDLAFLSNGFLGKLNSLKVQEWCECLYSYHTSDGGFAKYWDRIQGSLFEALRAINCSWYEKCLSKFLRPDEVSDFVRPARRSQKPNYKMMEKLLSEFETCGQTEKDPWLLYGFDKPSSFAVYERKRPLYQQERHPIVIKSVEEVNLSPRASSHPPKRCALHRWAARRLQSHAFSRTMRRERIETAIAARRERFSDHPGLEGIYKFFEKATAPQRACCPEHASLASHASCPAATPASKSAAFTERSRSRANALPPHRVRDQVKVVLRSSHEDMPSIVVTSVL